MRKNKIMPNKTKNKSKLISKNTAIVSFSDIKKSGTLSAEFHINRLKGASPYILKGGKYAPALPHEMKNAEYLTPIKVKHINNLLYSIKEIQLEIERIRKADIYLDDELIKESGLSARAKHTCYILCDSYPENNATLSDIANIPLEEWKKCRGMGIGTIKEVTAYLKKKGFELIEK